MPDPESGRIGLMELTSSLKLGGLEALIKRLVESFDPQRFRVVACAIETLGCFADQIRARGYPVYCLDKKPGITPSTWLKLAGVIRRERIDVVHAHIFQALWWGVPAARLAGAACVYSVHGNFFREAAHTIRAESLFARFATRITAVSNSSRDDLVAAGVGKPDDVIVIPNGVDVARYEITADRAAERARWGLPPEGPVIGLCSRIQRGKGIEHIVEAMPKLVDRFAGASALFVGSGDMLETYKQRAAELGVASHVAFTGYREDVPRLLALMDLFVLPSASEGLSMALLEAMAAGLPAVVTRVGDHAIAVADGQTGRVIDLAEIPRLAEVLIEVLSDGSRLREMGRLARERAIELYSHRKMVQNYEGLFTQLCRSRAS
jgi:glycosyltransferase involved in cell wall biosynthesis